MKERQRVKPTMTLGSWFSAIGLVLTSAGVLLAALLGE